jgi:hypothetical protein
MKKQSLKQEAKKLTVSYRPIGNPKFKVGFNGSVSDIYKHNPNTYLNAVKELSNRSYKKKRDSMYKSLGLSSKREKLPKFVTNSDLANEF